MENTGLIKYEAARKALIQAGSIDEVKTIRDKAEAMRLYGKQAKDAQLMNLAAEIKIRAERKCGEMLQQSEMQHGSRGVGKKVESQRATSLFAVGLSKSESSRYQKIAAIPVKVFESYLNDTVHSGKELTSAGMRRLVKSDRADKKKVRKMPKDIGHSELFTSDIEGLSEYIEPASLDWIITDPPYPEKYLSVWSVLSDFALYALKPGGSVLAMSGQVHLPEVISRLAERLDYHWMLSYATPGGESPQIIGRKVNSFWKPVLWYTKGKYSGDWVGDVLKSPVNDKDHHHWGQSLGGFEDIVERFTYPGQLICDPFLGGGTTAIAAVTKGRNFIGADIDTSCVSATEDRLKDMINGE